MLSTVSRHLRRFFRGSKGRELAPDEIFLDSRNLPEFNTHQFEGRLEKPISRRALGVLGLFFILIGIVFSSKAWFLQIARGAVYEELAIRNSLRTTPLFAERGVVYDRNGVELVWNVPSEDGAFAARRYKEESGFAHILGYVSYPSKDSSGFYYREDFIGTDGIEKTFQSRLGGENGVIIFETDVLGKVQSQSVVRPPRNGQNTTLALDSRLQSALYKEIEKTAIDSGFRGGAGVLLDVYTGEIISLVSYPEYDSNLFANERTPERVAEYQNNPDAPFLNRAIAGRYTPGSIVKPFVAIGALEEGIIDPLKQILSTGSITIPNPYHPESPSVFRDWKAHGFTDMRAALAVSSDVYFYTIGGGYNGQKGLGISGIEKYMHLFGLNEETGIELPGEEAGVIPNPDWKKENFDGEEWLLGNTYHTAIGQFGFQVTPLEMARAVGALANGGTLLKPKLLKSSAPGISAEKLSMKTENFTVVREGMRQAVERGTAQALSFPSVAVAAKTGTAQVGAKNEFMNSWIIGFFPYDAPRYAFAVVLERAPAGTLMGSPAAMHQFLSWVAANAPEYFE